jgi:hypothetical protein
MVHVPDHLAPASGVSNFTIRLGNIEIAAGGHPSFRFDMYEEDTFIASIPITIDDGAAGLLAAIADAHRELNDALRKMLYVSEAYRRNYEEQDKRFRSPSQP